MADQIERLNSAIGASIDLIRYAFPPLSTFSSSPSKSTKLKQTESTLLSIGDASDIKAHVESANQLKTVQTVRFPSCDTHSK
jgi:hypothetical protein